MAFRSEPGDTGILNVLVAIVDRDFDVVRSMIINNTSGLFLAIAGMNQDPHANGCLVDSCSLACVIGLRIPRGCPNAFYGIGDAATWRMVGKVALVKASTAEVFVGL